MSAHRPSQDRLEAMLAAAAAPAQPQELTGEQEVMMAFRERRLTTASRPRRTSMIKLAIAKLVSAKVAAASAAVAVTATGGIALAASTGAIPNPLGKRPAVPAASSSQHPQPSHNPQGEPDPSMFGLCVAFQAKAKSEQGAALQSPAFQALIEAAGDVEAVADFCATVQAEGPDAETPRGKPTSLPTPDGRPTQMPPARDNHPTAPVEPPTPTALPTGKH